MTKKPRRIASLEIKWPGGYYRTNIEGGADLNETYESFVSDFCKAVNRKLKDLGIKVPEIGIVDHSKGKGE